jgi:hypothetical protein
MPTLNSHTHCQVHQPAQKPKLGKECVCPTAPQTYRRTTKKKGEPVTEVLRHAG